MTSSFENNVGERKPRVLFLLHIPPPVHGSAMIGLSVKESKLINETFDCRYINLLASNTIAESGAIKLNKILGFISTWIKVFKTLILHRPKLCYLALTTKGPAFFRDLLLIALLKAFRIKIIYHLHNKGFKRNLTIKSYRIGYRFVLKNTDVILLSERLMYDISDFSDIIRTHICPNGIADEYQEAQYKKTQKSENGKCKILFLSNLIESKGVFVLLEACALLKSRNLSFECRFIGGEGNISIDQFNDKVQELGLQSIASYHGKKFGTEKTAEFANTDIFVFPTYYSNETFGLVNLEAMQHSKPVISTYEGGVPDVIEDSVTGFLVRQRDVQELAEKLTILIADKALRISMGKAGREKYEKEFTLDIFEKRLTQILLEVI